MYNIDKVAFGEFIAQLRKEKSLTQQELAEKLFISNKAVSKWETGLSMPDISLLMPLSEILGVSVTELLEGKRLDDTSGMSSSEVENIVKKALTFSEESPEKKSQRRRKNAAVFGVYAVLAAIELLALVLIYGAKTMPVNLWLYEGMSLFFGAYAWIFMRECLPAYYDENEIHVYSDGIFRINMVGVRFNNSNWGHILKGLRLWSAISLVLLPAAHLILAFISFELISSFAVQTVLLLTYLAALMVPIYVSAKKYG